MLPQGKFEVDDYAMIESYYADTHTESKITIKVPNRNSRIIHEDYMEITRTIIFTSRLYRDTSIA